MRYAFVAHFHTDEAALRQVLDAIATTGVGQLIFLGNIVGDNERAGSLCFERGMLTRVNRSLGRFESAEGGTIVANLVGVLAELAERSKAAVGVSWDNGVFQGRKIGNTTIQLYSGKEMVEMNYSDSPGGAQTVTITSIISEKSLAKD